jgi:hypothetical protein
VGLCLVLNYFSIFSKPYTITFSSFDQTIPVPAKEYISNKLFKSLEELESLINKLLNEGGLTIRWGRKIKNKGSGTIAS